MINYINKRRQQGLSLMEILLVVALIAFILIGGLTLYNRAQSTARIQRAQQQLLSMSASIKQLYSAYSSYDGLNNDVLVDSAAVPSDMLVDDEITNIFAGDVTIGPGTGCGGSNGDFCITFADVPDDACVQMITGGGSGGFQEIKVGTSQYVEAPISPTVASGLCGGGRNNTITWHF